MFCSEELEQAKARAEALRQRRRVAVAGNPSTDPVLWSHAASRARGALSADETSTLALPGCCQRWHADGHTRPSH